MTLPSAAPTVRLHGLGATCLTGLAVGLAGEMGWRCLALRVLDVPPALPSLQVPTLVVSAVVPVLGNGLGYFVSFRRLSRRSRLSFLVPSLLLTCLGLTIALAQLPASAGVRAVAVTVVAILITPVVVVALLLTRRLDADAGPLTA